MIKVKKKKSNQKGGESMTRKREKKKRKRKSNPKKIETHFDEQQQHDNFCLKSFGEQNNHEEF